MPEKKTAKMFGGMSENMPDRMADIMPDRMSDKMPDRMSDKHVTLYVR